MMKALLLAGVLLAGAAASAPVTLLPDGTYHYASTVSGHAIGSSTIAVHRSGNVITVGESASFAGVGLVSQRTIDATNFATLGYSVDFAGRHATMTIVGNEAILRQAGVTAKVSSAPGAPFVVNDNMVAGFAQIPATLHATGEKKLTLACACGRFVAVPIVVDAMADGRVTMTLQGMNATETFDPQTYVMKTFELPSQQLTIALQSYDPTVAPLPSPVVATPLPLPPAKYTSRDVAIRTNDGVTLAATLTMPGDAAARVPGVVLVHGSGCNDRNETIGPNLIFGQLANALSNDGYAVLRYDKRSCGKSGGTFPVRDRLIADARDAIAYLRAQPGIDPSRIFVLGHSEGGELAPSIAIADGRLAGIVLLAPPALPLEQIIMQQTLHTTTDADRASVQKEEQAELDAIAAGKKTGEENVWLRSSFGIDPAQLIAKVPCPILIVQGGKDIQVLAKDTPRLVDAAKATHRQLTVVMLPDDDHLFIKLAPGDSSSGAEYFIPAYLDPQLLRAIESWLAAHT